MPTTFTGVLLFLVLLLPGFAYLVGKERSGTERHTSPFRETVAIVAASASSEIAVLILLAAARLWWPSLTPDMGGVVRGGSAYLRQHYRELAAWGIAMLAVSVVLAYAATLPAIRRAMAALPLVGPYPHDSTVSAWWLVLERLAEGREVHVGCILDDGSYVRGRLQSFNNSANDDPDRELVLAAPIAYRPSQDDEEQPYPVSGACVAARHIVTLFVSYAERVNSSSEAEVVARAPTAD
jgi:Family of unknown function (DUF6338)